MQWKGKNSIVVNKSSFKPKIPKPIVIVFIVLQVVFGFEYGFSKAFRGRTRSAIEYLSIIASLIFVAMYLSPSYFVYHAWWWWFNLIKYAATFCVLKTVKYKMYNFLKECHRLSENVTGLNNNNVGIIFMFYTLLIYLSKFILFFICVVKQKKRCSGVEGFTNEHKVVFDLFRCIIDATPGSIIIISYYLYCLVKDMTDSYTLENNLVKFEQRYVTIANLHDKIYPLCKNVILIELFINIPRLMETLWHMLLYIKENAEWYFYTSEWFLAFHLTIQMCIPAVLAEMVNSQMNSIGLMLNEQLRVEKDKEKSEDIIRILRYIKARRLQNDIWRVIPVDLRLPLSMFSLCTTYFIVLLQFTHLYD